MSFVLILALTCSLQGCVFVAGAAAGAAAIAVVYDHRKLEQILLDQKIAKQIEDKMQYCPGFCQNTHINVSCFNRVVLLTGEASNPALREQADSIAHSIPNVCRVYNQITVQCPSSTLSRTNDAWITTKIKSQMLATKDLASGSIKVVTEDATVYLMGLVNHKQSCIAVDISRQTSGVRRVIRIFQYTD